MSEKKNNGASNEKSLPPKTAALRKPLASGESASAASSSSSRKASLTTVTAISSPITLPSAGAASTTSIAGRTTITKENVAVELNPGHVNCVENVTPACKKGEEGQFTKFADYFVICGLDSLNLDLDSGLEPDKFAGLFIF